MQFQHIVGQTHAKEQMLATMNAGKLPHALLICGNEGIGKLAFATAIVQYMNCLHPSDADSCGECTHCTAIQQAAHPDVHFILPIINAEEKGKKLLSDFYLEDFRNFFTQDPYFSFEQWQNHQEGQNKQLMISVEEVREAKRKLSFKTFQAKFKVLIVWNIEKMNVNGANAFLKLLEEPPERTLIVMTCSEPARLLATINSRCQRLFLSRLQPHEVERYLETELTLPHDQSKQIACIAEGSISNAKSYITETGMMLNQLYIDWLRACFMGNYANIQLAIEPILKQSKELQKSFLLLAVKKIRDSFLFKLSMQDLALVTESEKPFHEKFSAFVSAEKVELILQEIERSQSYLAQNANAQMIFSSLSLKIFFIFKGY